MFYWPSPRYAVEAVHKFEPNVVSFELAKGERQWYTVGCYLAPDDTLMIESISAAIK